MCPWVTVRAPWLPKERCLLVGCVLRRSADPWFVRLVFALLLVVADHSVLAAGSRQSHA
jgi:hypothetical protein